MNTPKEEEEVVESVGCDGVGVMAGNRPCVGGYVRDGESREELEQ